MIGVTGVDPFPFCFAVGNIGGASGGTTGNLVVDLFPFCLVIVGIPDGLLLNITFAVTVLGFPAIVVARPLEESCMEPSISILSASDPFTDSEPDLRHLPLAPPQDCSVIEGRGK